MFQVYGVVSGSYGERVIVRIGRRRFKTFRGACNTAVRNGMAIVRDAAGSVVFHVGVYDESPSS